MRDTTLAAGAMPVAADARSAQSYPFGPGWAVYRLPFPGLNGNVSPREVGIGFEGEPAAGGATPPAGTPPPIPSQPPAPPATGDPDALGDPGKRALDEERAARKRAEDAAKALQKQLEELQAANQSDADKAIAEAKKAGAAEVLARVHAQVRRSEVKAALTAAGINATVLDLAAKADEFAELKVTDEGEVEGLADAVKAFKAARPDLFKAPAAAGSADGGPRGQGGTVTRDQLKGMTPQQINEAFEKGQLDALLSPGR